MSKDIKPRMVDGVGYCDAECPQCLVWDDHDFQVRCAVDKKWRLASHPKLAHLKTSRICPPWARRTAEERDRWRAWAEGAREELAKMHRGSPGWGYGPLLRDYPKGGE